MYNLEIKPTTDKIFKILAQAKKEKILPENLNITITNDQSDFVKKMVNNLENTIIMGIIFVVLVLFTFLGLRNALFVGIAIPMSMFISFVVLNLIGLSMMIAQLSMVILGFVGMSFILVILFCCLEGRLTMRAGSRCQKTLLVSMDRSPFRITLKAKCRRISLMR